MPPARVEGATCRSRWYRRPPALRRENLLDQINGLAFTGNVGPTEIEYRPEKDRSECVANISIERRAAKPT